MRVAVLHGSNDLYGASRVLLDDVRIFAQRGAHVDVVVPCSGPLDTAVPTAGGRLVVDPTLRVLRRSGSAASAVPFRLPAACHHADAVLVWTLALAPYLPLLRASRKHSVLAVHEILEGARGRLLALWGQSLASSVVANSRATRDWFVAGSARREVEVIYPIAPAWRPAPFPDTPLTVLLAGRVNGNKGHLLAVDAVERVRLAGVSINLVLAGAPFPGQEAHLEALLKRLERAPWATYVGEHAGIDDLLAESHGLVVGTTVPEPFGLVCLEAWSKGRMVVAPDSGGTAEAVRLVEGVTYRSSDADSLAQALLMLSEADAFRTGTRADAPVADQCSVAARADGWDRVLRW
jgi:glycosyltransferase involved in cell wall biosynthesis